MKGYFIKKNYVVEINETEDGSICAIVTDRNDGSKKLFMDNNKQEVFKSVDNFIG